MRYRLDWLDDHNLFVRNVETDVPLGAVHPYEGPDPQDPNRCVFKGCSVLNNDGEEIALLRSNRVRDPFKLAAVAIANDEHGSGFAGLKDAPKNPDAHRAEFQLGEIMADTVTEFLRGGIENSNGGLQPEAKRTIIELITRLHNFLWVSRFGSFDAERQVHDQYFANTPACYPRMNFAAAAQHYGLLELQMRHPEASEATLKQMLALPLELLDATLKRVFPLDDLITLAEKLRH